MCKWYPSNENRIDPCMREIVSNLQRAGPNTLASCCGHGKNHKTVIVRTVDGRNVDYYSGVVVPRKKRFYVRDQQGMFFIPEVEKAYFISEKVIEK